VIVSFNSKLLSLRVVLLIHYVMMALSATHAVDLIFATYHDYFSVLDFECYFLLHLYAVGFIADYLVCFFSNLVCAIYSK
jgi:hypothetical protein